MPAPPVTAELASFIVGMHLEDVPPAHVELSRLAILDTLGVTLAGSAEEAGPAVTSYALSQGAPAEATVLGSQVRTSAATAALANGTLAHAMDFDDMHTGTAGHPSAVIVPAAFAVAERNHSTGRELLESFVVGFELLYRVGREVGMPSYTRGYHPTGLWGPLGSAASTARLDGLPADVTRVALGIAASQMSGVRGNFGTMVKPFHAGWGAMAGIMACGLAQCGVTASRSIIESPNGVLDVFGDDMVDAERVVAGLGREFWTFDGYGVKLYPSCGKTHAAIDAALHLREVEGVMPDAIAAIEIAASPTVKEPLCFPRPTSSLEAKFSMEYCTAIAFVDGAAGPAQFTDERVRAPDIMALVERSNMVHPEGAGGWDAFLDSETVTVHLHDGRSLSYRVDRASGDLGQAVDAAGVVRKFRECAGVVLAPGEIDRVLELWEGLEALDDVATLAALLGTSRVGR